ncbi:unnamed protein product [Periconia digitata]|uniref:Uncharacterized protein n=1 Tax=Periconia digitata TaxID=1303443 RepID=A0A9W4UAP8_9PLEO|nr:unnamed protein product [Periconia digitata]
MCRVVRFPCGFPQKHAKQASARDAGFLRPKRAPRNKNSVVRERTLDLKPQPSRRPFTPSSSPNPFQRGLPSSLTRSLCHWNHRRPASLPATSCLTSHHVYFRRGQCTIENLTPRAAAIAFLQLSRAARSFAIVEYVLMRWIVGPPMVRPGHRPLLRRLQPSVDISARASTGREARIPAKGVIDSTSKG